ncbi:MAG: nicotinate (nicotinamide) nucleotide adenylyltransferase [Sedimentisphaerales bacterium]|nr:nicotinate (nicotinamide) nucleotide adenylyltransferase [Sedimentisphaerales bacterium]
MAPSTIALFGGTFDPIHLGHATVAEAAARQIEAEKVIFIPAKCSPLKGFAPRAGDADRLRMIELTLADNETFLVSDCELHRPAPSYTLDTVRHFKKEYGPATTVHWLLGADSIDDLVHWYGIEDLIDECSVTTMQRAGYETPDFDRFEPAWGAQRVGKLKRNVVQTPLIDVSSTEIRKRLRSGSNVEGMLHPDVIEYVNERGLYREPDATTD